MKVMVVGSGGREHALCWKIKQSELNVDLYCAPGNTGIEDHVICVPIASEDITALLKFAIEEKIDLTVVGPEAPLVAGIVDEFKKNGLLIFGPTKAAAQLEGSKAFSKKFMKQYGIPTAKFDVFSDYNKAISGLKKYEFPVVIKASGLAAGKGVIICQNQKQAEIALRVMLLDHALGDAGSKVVIEEFLQGVELSILVITDGEKYLILPPSQDHKRLLDGDEGPNTGGMGAYAPSRQIYPELLAKIEEEIIKPTLQGMRESGSPFTGCLYFGLIIDQGAAKVLEYNCRFGDPETQVVLPLVRSDLVPIFMDIAKGNLRDEGIEIYQESAVCVVLASGGYPGLYEKGKVIQGLDAVPDRAIVFHAGTAKLGNQIVTNGGRVLGVTAESFSLRSAIIRAYQAADCITFEGKTYRKDIALHALDEDVQPAIGKRRRGRPRKV